MIVKKKTTVEDNLGVNRPNEKLTVHSFIYFKTYALKSYKLHLINVGYAAENHR